MRKIFTLSLLLAATAASARQISPDEAKSAADAFLISKSLVPVEVAQSLTRSGEQPYYVFNAADNNGFVIISGDDRFSKVLGYSDRGSFDKSKMPPQLKAMLDNFAENTAKPSNFTSTHPSWNTTFSTRADEGVLLETAEWGQDAPFNAETPMFGDQHAPTGCVATAMAIVMKYHSWPETYNWDAMPMKIEYDGENPPAPNPELARLMKDAGEAVYMAYGADESGAEMFRIGTAFRYLFDYNPECQYIEEERFQKDFWKNVILENLDKGYPVIYGGFGSGGHAFVFDGYNKDGFHVNWGWDGWLNGYYNIDALNPGGADFNEQQSMILNIVPNKNHIQHSLCYTDYGYEWVGKGLGEAMNISVENVKTGEPFHLIHSYGITAKAGFDGVIGVALVDNNNNIKEVLQTQPFSTYSPGDNAYVNCNRSIEFLNLIVAGDITSTDRLQLVSKDKGDNDYRLIYGTLEVPSYVGVVNNSPRYSEFTFDIGEGMTFNCSSSDVGLTKLTSGISNRKLLKGCGIDILWEIDNVTSDKTVGVFITFPNDTIVYTGSTGAWRVNYPDKANIQAKILTLKDKSLAVSTPGNLKSLVSLEEAASIKSLSLSGIMDATDFWYIRDCFRSLESLDLKDVAIAECHATDKDSYIDHHAANILPIQALWGANSITRLILPDSLEGIGENSLLGVYVKTLSIPKGVKTILKSNFGEIGAFELLNPEPIEINPIAFIDPSTPSRSTLFVPEGSASKYREAPVWGEFKSIIEGKLPTNLFAVVGKDGVKYECGLDEAVVVGPDGEPKDIVIPDIVNISGDTYKVSKIKENAFNRCSSLESVIIGDEVTEIGSFSLAECNSLKKVVLGKGLKKIGTYALAYNPELEECNLPASLAIIGEGAFKCSGLKKVVIPASATPANNRAVFSNMANLKTFVVDKDNKWFKVIDDCLYRVSNKELILESVPCLKSGILRIADECSGVMSEAIFGTQLEELVFNENCRNIPEYSVFWNSQLNYISLPKNSSIYPDAFKYLDNLNSVMFTGSLKMQDNVFNECPSLKNIVIDSANEIVNLNGIFASPVDEINIFTSSKEKSFEYSGKYKLFVAGATSDEFANDDAEEVHEMWGYGIDREEKVLTITPQVDGLAIERVLVNGKEAENIYSSRAETTPAFVCAVDDPDNLNVTVEYSLFGSQKMSCEYKSEFNAELPHTPSGVSQVWIDSSVAADVYTIDGLQVLRNASKEQINRLANGVYILRQGNRSRKVVIRN